MANLLDYLHWRGDLDFKVSPFNEVDAAILAMLSYIHLQGIIPGCDTCSRKSIKETSLEYFSNIAQAGPDSKGGEFTLDARFNASLEDLLRALSDCPRFEAVQISGFDEDIDFQVGRQFAAMTFTLPDASPEHVVAFRGTDNTVVGWQEDFELVYMEQTPAQESARLYLEKMLAALPGQYMVCGHSKGGNLAVYASAHIDPADQNRLMKIINFDGPGFDFAIVDRTPFLLCDDKIVNIVPEESMVGMLLDSIGKRIVVASSARYASQHNAFHWQVKRTQFTRGRLADVAKLLDQTIKTWLSEISLAERQAFLETFFDLLGASEGTVLLADPLQNLKDLKRVLQKYSQLDKETKRLLNQVFGSFTAQTRRTVSTTIKEKLPRRKWQYTFKHNPNN